MKYNESLKPNGIGKKQVAFNIPKNASAMSIADANYEEQTVGANDGILHQANANATALSRVIAYSAATSAINNNYSSPFGINGIEDFTIPTSINGNTAWHEATVKFSQTGAKQPANSEFYLSADGSLIIPKKSGWYLVNSLFYLGDHTGNHKYKYNAYPADQVEDLLSGGDYQETQTYPTLRFSNFIPVIGFDAYGRNEIDPYGFGTNYPLGGIQTIISVYGNNAAINVTSTNSRAWMQCIWISPLTEARTYNPA
jgi:hypothetical protein